MAVVAWIALGIGVGFRVDGFFPALVGALIITIVESGPDRDPVRTWHDVITGDGGGGAERVEMKLSLVSAREPRRHKLTRSRAHTSLLALTSAFA